MLFPRHTTRLLVPATMLLLVTVSAFAQDLRSSLFKQTDAILEQARAANAPLLSPSFYNDAMKNYADAENKLAKNKSIDSIKEDLTDVNLALGKAIENAKLAEVTFAAELNIRNAAAEAQADLFAPEEWEDAEGDFANAASALEDGNVNRARSRVAKAAAGYSEAELIAIQAAILGEARALIAADRDDRVEREAPETLAAAERLVAQAEADLVTNRYATELPLKMAVEAEYQAKHAAYIASQARRLRSKEVTPENFLLEWEAPLVQIATALDTSTDFSNGYAVPTEASLARIADAKETIKATNQNVVNLTARVGELEEQLGITTKLAEAGALRRKQLADLQALFSPGEAQILREGNQIIIRLIGLQFTTGQAVIESRYFTLLRKLDQVPDIFPGSSLIVEGHTDAQGSDATNLVLSERRANSVRDYLLASTLLNASEVKSVGFGESRPIANNESAQGRAQNRRTDVIVVPATEQL